MRTRDGTGSRIGRQNALLMVPTAMCSVGIILILTPGSGQASLIALSVWMAGGFALATRTGERCWARSTGLRRLRCSPATARLIRAALRTSGFDGSAFDWYVARTNELNAFAFGRHGIAVTSGLLTDVERKRCSEQMFIALLVHEQGHHATAATRFMLPMRWWSGPWVTGVRLVGALSVSVFGGRSGSRVPSCVLWVGFAVAAVQSVIAGRWGDASVLAALVIGAVVIPVLTAAVRRQSEWAADRFAARSGVAADLAAALRALDNERQDPSIVARILADHPSTRARVGALDRYARRTGGHTHREWRNPGDVAVASDRSGVFTLNVT